MKTTLVFVLLALSVAANAALVMKLRARAAGSAVPSPEASAAASAQPKGNATSASTRPVAATHGANRAAVPAPVATQRLAGTDWATLTAGGDLPTLVERLRAAGFPPLFVHAITWAELNELFAEQRRELLPPEEPYAFWTNQSPFQVDPVRLAARRAITREQNRLMKELLGPDAHRETPMSSSFRRQFGDLPREKIDQLEQITQDYNDLTMQARMEAQSMMLREDREKLAFLEQEKQRDISQVLTPEEFENYLLRSSPTAQQMRFQLATFEPTEQEFRTLYKLQAEFDAKYSYQYGSAPRTIEGQQERRAAEQKLLADAKAMLGEERGAEFERSRDYSYQSVANIAKRLELPKETALQVWNVQKDVEQRANGIRSNRELTPEQQSAQLAALQKEATAKVSTALGDRGYSAYKESGGQWMQNLVPPSRTAPKG